MLDDCNIFSLEKTETLFKQMEYNFSMTIYGYIDCKKVDYIIKIKCVSDIFDVCNKTCEYYILWDNQDMPCISCKLEKIIEHIDDVLAVSFDTWILSKDAKEVIQFHHDGNIIYCRNK